MTEPAPSPAGPTGRSAWIEWARVLSCAGIVWFHAGAPFENFALGGLVAFTILGGAFIRRLDTPRQFSASVWSRGRRLLLPWLVWSVIFAALRMADAVREGQPVFGWVEPRMALYGTFLHLWFLPFLFVATIFAQAVDVLPQVGRRAATAIGWCLVAATPACVWLENQHAGAPFDQWVSVLPALGLGFVLRDVRPGASGAGRVVAIAILGDALAIGATALLMPEYTSSLTKHTVGGLVLLSWLVFSPASTLAKRLGALTLLVYLAHPLILVVAEGFLGFDVASAPVAAIAVLASFALGFAIDQSSRIGQDWAARLRQRVPLAAESAEARGG